MFADKLKELRVSRGIKQEELANEIGVGIRAIQTYEQGLRTPPLETVIKIADFFSVDLEYFRLELDYLADRNINIVYGDEEGLLKLIRQLPEDKKKLALKILEQLK